MDTINLLAMAPGGEGGGGLLPTLLFFGAMFAIMYFLMIRPQQKRQKEHKQMLEGIKKGDKVITSTGMHGKVVDMDEKTFLIQIADNVKVRFEKASVNSKKDSSKENN